MQTKAATLHFNAVKTCFIALPKTLTTLTFARDKVNITFLFVIIIAGERDTRSQQLVSIYYRFHSCLLFKILIKLQVQLVLAIASASPLPWHHAARPTVRQVSAKYLRDLVLVDSVI